MAGAIEFLPWLVPVLLIGAVAYVYDGLFLGLTAGRALRNARLVSLPVYLPLAALAVRRLVGSGRLGYPAGPIPTLPRLPGVNLF